VRSRQRPQAAECRPAEPQAQQLDTRAQDQRQRARERVPGTRHQRGNALSLCPGASLGKLEAELALEELARRWPHLALVEGQELRFHPNISFRGPQEL
jgi:hypothetical protein